MQTAVKTLIRLADAQADLILRWTHMPFCWFCHEAVQLNVVSLKSHNVSKKMQTVANRVDPDQTATGLHCFP